MVVIDHTPAFRSLLVSRAEPTSSRSKSPSGGRSVSRSRNKDKGKGRSLEDEEGEAFLKEAYRIVSQPLGYLDRAPTRIPVQTPIPSRIYSIYAHRDSLLGAPAAMPNPIHYKAYHIDALRSWNHASHA